MPISKARKQRLDAMAKARANNRKNNSNISLNDALMETQLETNDPLESDTNLEDQNDSRELFDEYDSDATPEILTSEDSQDPDYASLPPKNMVIPDSFLVQIMKKVACIECGKAGGIVPNVTKASEFHNEVTFTC